MDLEYKIFSWDIIPNLSQYRYRRKKSNKKICKASLRQIKFLKCEENSNRAFRSSRAFRKMLPEFHFKLIHSESLLQYTDQSQISSPIRKSLISQKRLNSSEENVFDSKLSGEKSRDIKINCWFQISFEALKIIHE